MGSFCSSIILYCNNIYEYRINFREILPNSATTKILCNPSWYFSILDNSFSHLNLSWKVPITRLQDQAIGTPLQYPYPLKHQQQFWNTMVAQWYGSTLRYLASRTDSLCIWCPWSPPFFREHRAFWAFERRFSKHMVPVKLHLHLYSTGPKIRFEGQSKSTWLQYPHQLVHKKFSGAVVPFCFNNCRLETLRFVFSRVPNR